MNNTNKNLYPPGAYILVGNDRHNKNKRGGNLESSKCHREEWKVIGSTRLRSNILNSVVNSVVIEQGTFEQKFGT